MPSILIIDNSRFVRTVLSAAFDSEGFRVRTVTRLSELPDVFGEGLPDAVVVDLLMPDASGFEFIRAIRRLCATAIPVVVYSGADANLVRESSRGLDIAGVIAKAEGIEPLVELVKRLVAGRRVPASM